MFSLSSVVPWGRSFDEYCRMFRLGERELRLRTIGCGDGPASFNAEAAARGLRVTSCDPIYQFNASQLRQRIGETSVEVIDQTRRNADEFVWTSIPSIEALQAIRLAAMERFLGDFDAATRAGRYVAAALPDLPFRDDSFDIALCSHFLFLYTAQLGDRFHRAAILEMCRVAPDVRIFPLVALGGRPSPLVDSARASLSAAGFTVSIEPVDYEFQRGGNEMMRITRPAGAAQPRSAVG